MKSFALPDYLPSKLSHGRDARTGGQNLSAENLTAENLTAYGHRRGNELSDKRRFFFKRELQQNTDAFVGGNIPIQKFGSAYCKCSNYLISHFTIICFLQ